MIEKKTIFREYFPGYHGHIPLKNEIIGMTVGATNDQIKSILNKQPPSEDILIPSSLNDYSYYGKNYFCDNFSKDYKLEEDMIYSNKSKDAKTWINGSKYRIYPQHIPGYTAHIPGKESSNIFGTSYSKATALAIKGEYCKKSDFSKGEKYKSMHNVFFTKPKMRSEEENEYLNKVNNLKKLNELKEENNLKISNSIEEVENKNEKKNLLMDQSDNSFMNGNELQKLEESGFRSKILPKEESKLEELPQKFKEILLEKEIKEFKSELPYIVGYKGFRRGVKSGNYYGQNFIDTSHNAKKDIINRVHYA